MLIASGDGRAGLALAGPLLAGGVFPAGGVTYLSMGRTAGSGAVTTSAPGGGVGAAVVPAGLPGACARAEGPAFVPVRREASSPITKIIAIDRQDFNICSSCLLDESRTCGPGTW